MHGLLRARCITINCGTEKIVGFLSSGAYNSICATPRASVRGYSFCVSILSSNARARLDSRAVPRARTCFPSPVAPRRKTWCDFPTTFTLFLPLPSITIATTTTTTTTRYYYCVYGATLLFSTANTPPPPPPSPPPRRPSAFNLRAHHRAAQEQVQPNERTNEPTGETKRRGWKRERRPQRDRERRTRAG